MTVDLSKLALTNEEWRHVELVPAGRLEAGAITAQVAHGASCSVILATRSAGYHSKPHTHAAEQINYVISGEAWLFVEEQGFFGGAGSVSRIPAGAVHWAWNTGSEPLTVLEFHTPPLTGDPKVRDERVPLGLTPEELEMVRHVHTEWPDDFDPKPVEKRWVGRHHT